MSSNFFMIVIPTMYPNQTQYLKTTNTSCLGKRCFALAARWDIGVVFCIKLRNNKFDTVWISIFRKKQNYFFDVLYTTHPRFLFCKLSGQHCFSTHDVFVVKRCTGYFYETTIRIFMEKFYQIDKIMFAFFRLREKSLCCPICDHLFFPPELQP
jgi:hypothetical protein